MKRILQVIIASLALAVLGGCGGSDSGGSGVIGAGGTGSGSASGAGAASGAAGTFLALVSSIVASTSDTATPVAVDSVTAATDPVAGPSPIN